MALLTAASSSSIEPEPEAEPEPEIDVASLGEEELRTELVKVRILPRAASLLTSCRVESGLALPTARRDASVETGLQQTSKCLTICSSGRQPGRTAENQESWKRALSYFGWWAKTVSDPTDWKACCCRARK